MSVEDRVRARIVAAVADVPNTRMRVADRPDMGWWAICPACASRSAAIEWRGLAALRVVCWCPESPVTLARRLGLADSLLATEDLEAHEVGQREVGADDGDAEPEGPRSLLNLQPVSVLLAKTIPPAVYLYPEYIPALSFGELVGPPGLGKTLLMIYLMTRMAKSGLRCALIELEGGERGLQDRIGRAVEEAGKGVTDMIHYSHAPPISLMDSSNVVTMAEELASFDFVLFDSFARASAGLDEDKSKDMGPLVEKIDYIRRNAECAVWLNHHTGKSKWEPGTIPRLGDGRGSSALPGALDAELSIVPVSDAEQEQGFAKFMLHVTKMRDGDDKIPARLVTIAMNGPAALVTMNTRAEVATASHADAHMMASIIEYISAAGPVGRSMNQIEHNVTGKGIRIREAVGALHQVGSVVKNEKDRWASSRLVPSRPDEPRDLVPKPLLLRKGLGDEPSRPKETGGDGTNPREDP